ncbi:hypothetical protein H0H92_008753 [Tricholoma furcatifolium]|nr:hypothetical protein H0H92_008753 [Tricholoma furcatifolium]
MRLSSVSLLLVAANLPSALAWGAAGHEIVATIAQIHLHPNVLPALCNILSVDSNVDEDFQCHLAPISTWADRLKNRMRWSASMHYVGGIGDHPPQLCKFPGSKGWEGPNANVLLGIRNTTDLLAQFVEGKSGVKTASEALKFLVHFVGDMHQPLHLTGRDRGGNSDKVRFGQRTTNLHSLWDTLLVAKAIRETPGNYSYPLPSHQIESVLRGTIYDSYIRRIFWEGLLSQWSSEQYDWLACASESSSSAAPSSLWQQVLSTARLDSEYKSRTDVNVVCPYHWAQPLHTLNCDIVWPPKLDESPFSVQERAAIRGIGREHDCHEHSDESEDLGDDEFAPRSPRTPLLQLDTPEYAGRIKDEMILEKLLAQAGIRLAAVLNWLFADVVEGEIVRGTGRLNTPELEL